MAKKRLVDKSIRDPQRASHRQHRLARNLCISIVALTYRVRRLYARVGTTIKGVLASMLKALKSVVQSLARHYVQCKSRFILSRKRYTSAKPLSGEETDRAVRANVKCMTSRMLNNIIHYCLPVLSAGFLIASVRYTAALQYGIDTTYTQEDVASVAQLQLDGLEDTTQPLEDNKVVTVFPKLSFKTIEQHEDALVNALDTDAQSDYVDGMSEGYGVFLEDEFLGAVLDKSSIDSALESILDEYRGMDGVTDVHFAQKVTYTQGLYLTEYMVDPQTIVDTLTGNAQEDMFYTIEYGDTLTLISEITGLSIDEILALNPKITDPDVCMAGDTILIQQSQPFLKVEYTQSMVDTTQPTETTEPQLQTLTPTHYAYASTDDSVTNVSTTPQEPAVQAVLSKPIEYTQLSQSFVYPINAIDTILVVSHSSVSVSSPRGMPTAIYTHSDGSGSQRGYPIEVAEVYHVHRVSPRQYTL